MTDAGVSRSRACCEGIDGARVRGDAGVADRRGARRFAARSGAGDLFVAVPGTAVDGRRFLADAVGARRARRWSIEGERAGRAARSRARCVAVPNARRALGVIARQPLSRGGRALELSAVTGTNGKTTTTYIVEAMLRAAGLSPGVVGTVSYRARAAGAARGRRR